MSQLGEADAQRISDSLFMTLYGVELFKKMRKAKRNGNFSTESQFIAWVTTKIQDDKEDEEKKESSGESDAGDDDEDDGSAYLSVEEVQNVADVVLMTLYGSEIYSRLQQIKSHLGLPSEALTLAWMLDQFDLAGGHVSSTSSTVSSVGMREAVVAEEKGEEEEEVEVKESLGMGDEQGYYYEEEVVGKMEGERLVVDTAHHSYSKQSEVVGEDGEVGEVGGGDVKSLATAATTTGNTSLIPIRIILNPPADGVSVASTGSNMQHYTVLTATEFDQAPASTGVVQYQLDSQGGVVEVVPSSSFLSSTSSQTQDSPDCFVNEQRYFTMMKNRRPNRRGRLPASQAGQYPPPDESDLVTPSGRPVKRFGCELCSYVTRRRGDLGKHYRTHTGEKPFTCSWCGKTFNVSSNLNSHILAIHQELKTFVCRFCDYQTSVKQSFRRHLVRRHGYESNYRCGECGKYFYSTTLLKAHLKRHDEQLRRSLTAPPSLDDVNSPQMEKIIHD